MLRPENPSLGCVFPSRYASWALATPLHSKRGRDFFQDQCARAPENRDAAGRLKFFIRISRIVQLRTTCPIVNTCPCPSPFSREHAALLSLCVRWSAFRPLRSSWPVQLRCGPRWIMGGREQEIPRPRQRRTSSSLFRHQVTIHPSGPCSP